MYIADSRRASRNYEAIARAHELIRMQQMALRHYEEGLTQRDSASRMNVTRGTVIRLLAKLNLANVAVERGTLQRLLKKHESKTKGAP